MSHIFLLGWDPKAKSLHYNENMDPHKWIPIANFDGSGTHELNPPKCCTTENKNSFFILFENPGECEVGSQIISN